MKDIITCKKCGGLCDVDGEFPKFFAWCESCNDYATYNMDEYNADYYSRMIDNIHETKKYEGH